MASSGRLLVRGRQGVGRLDQAAAHDSRHGKVLLFWYVYHVRRRDDVSRRAADRELLATNTDRRRWRRVRALRTRAVRSVHRLRHLVAALHRLRARGATTARRSWPWPRSAACSRRRRRPLVRRDSPATVRLRRRRAAYCAVAQLVAGERCDKQATLEYDEALVAAGDVRGALADSDDYFAKCGDWYRLRWVTYAAHEQLGEHAAAADEATKLIAHDPEDHDYPWWRAVAYEEMGRLDDAIRDYRRTLALEPGSIASRSTWRACSRRKGKFCAAREPILQFVGFHPELRRPSERARSPRAAAHPRSLRRLAYDTLDAAVEPEIERVFGQRARPADRARAARETASAQGSSESRASTRCADSRRR